MYPVIPPRVDYTLTPLGRSLLAIVEALVAWSGDHVGDVEQARRHYDTAHRANGSGAATEEPERRSVGLGPGGAAIRAGA
jgi:hypothetical protein